MPAKNKSSISTKLTGFAIVIAIVFFGAKSQMPFTQQRASDQSQKTQFPVVAVPVDRSLLSQQLLPVYSNFNRASENTSYPSTEPEIYAESNQGESKTGPSPYELRLDDQKAWGSQPRRASLVSTTKQSVESSEKVAGASSQTPIVPGHVDPHLWYESQHPELAIGLKGEQKEQLKPNEPVEFSELPALPAENSLSAILRPETLSAKAIPEKLDPEKAVPVRAVRVAHAWETGRY